MADGHKKKELRLFFYFCSRTRWKLSKPKHFFSFFFAYKNELISLPLHWNLRFISLTTTTHTKEKEKKRGKLIGWMNWSRHPALCLGATVAGSLFSMLRDQKGERDPEASVSKIICIPSSCPSIPWCLRATCVFEKESKNTRKHAHAKMEDSQMKHGIWMSYNLSLSILY